MKSLSIPLIMLISILFVSCSSSQRIVNQDIEGNPMLPSEPMITSSPLYVSDFDSSGNPLAGNGLLGLFTVNVNFKTFEYEIVPLRKNNLTDTLEVVDITNFLTLAPCVNCVKISSIGIDPDGHPIVRLGIRHPFDEGDPLKPITGRNRADLHVFNVEGIVAITDDNVNNFPSLGIMNTLTGLQNPDGYSTYLDPYLDEILPSTANVHPYIMHFDDYGVGNFDPLNPMGFVSVTDPPPSGNLVMAMGCDYNYQDYVFNIPAGESIGFLFAVGCSYGVSAASKSLRFTPEYRVPQHNKKAASEVRVEVISNALEPGNTSSTAQLEVEVLDINHGVAVGDALNRMAFDSSVADILVEVPGITSAAQSDFVFVDGDGRDPMNPLVFNATITNTAGGGLGNYQGLVKVLDSYPVGQNASPLLNGMDGIKRVDPLLNPLTGLFMLNEFATYATFEIEVSISNLPPVANLLPDPGEMCLGHPITFDATASYDPDGSIVRYDWDWDYSGNPSQFNIMTTTTIGTADCPPYTTAGMVLVAVRVVDDSTPEANDIAVVELYVYDTDFVPYTSIIPIPTTGLTNIVYTHTQENIVLETHRPCRGMEGLACADGYIYAVFYAEDPLKGIFFTRSSDRGDTWDTPVKVATMPTISTYGGCAIDATGTGVYIAYSTSGYRQNDASNDGDITLLSNLDHGTGAFQVNVVRDMPTGTSLGFVDLAVDPLDPDNIYVVYGNHAYSWSTLVDWWWYDYIRVTVSNDGPAGPYIHHQMMGASDEDDDNYGMDVAVSPVDGDVYIMSGEAYYVAIYRSDDHGATFPSDDLHYERFFGTGYYWARDFDLALHPTNGDIFYVIVGCRRDILNIRVFGSTDGINLSVITDNLTEAPTGRRLHPAITVGPYGDVYATWADNRTGNLEIYADHMPPFGSFGTDVQISSGNATQESDPEIIVTPDGCDVIIVWEENRDQSSGTLNTRKG